MRDPAPSATLHGSDTTGHAGPLSARFHADTMREAPIVGSVSAGLWRGGVRLLAVMLAAWGGDGCTSSSPATRGMVVRHAGQTQRRFALLIGNGGYRAQRPLPNAPNDASAMAQTLERMGFSTQQLIDGSLDQMEGAIDRFARRLDAGDLALVFYSGHGVSYRGTNYLVPVEFTGADGAALASGAYSLHDLMTRLTARGSTNVLIFDACRDSPLGRGLRERGGLGANDGTGAGLAAVQAPAGSIVVYSTAPGRTALDADPDNASARALPADPNHSPFTSSLLRHLDRPRDIELVLRDVRREVMQRTNGVQTPWSESSLVGEVVLSTSVAANDEGSAAASSARAAEHEESPAAPAAIVHPPSGPSCPEGMVLITAGDLRGQRVESFCMDRTEVTVSAYGACPNCSTPNTGDRCNWGRADRTDHPVNCVGWTQAEAFCRWRGGRLPTEFEWEYGAVGSDGRTYPWGNEAPSNQLCWRSSENEGTCSVGSFPSGRSPFGLDDMSGNVWEWTSTVDRRDLLRVYRGGGWSDSDRDPSWVRAAARDRDAPAYRSYVLGFRCARGVM